MATTSAFTNIHTGLKQDNNHPLDGRTYYNTIAEALADNPTSTVTLPPSFTPTIETNRFIGQKMVIVNPPNSDSPREYWFKDGITDSDLVEYTSDGNYYWEKIDAFGGGGGSGGSGGVSIGTVSLSNVSHLTNAVIKSKVLGFANDSHKLVYFTINATISNYTMLPDTVVGTLSVAPDANTAISVYRCASGSASKGRIMSNGDIQITVENLNNYFNIIISGCFVTGAT